MLSYKASYLDLLENVNSLFLFNCHFIYLISIENINSLERKKGFDDFKENFEKSNYYSLIQILYKLDKCNTEDKKDVLDYI